MISNYLLTNSANSIVSADSTQDVGITCIQFCNITNTSDFEVPMTVNIDVHLVPSGMSPSNQTLIYSKVAITAGDTFIVDQERIVLGNGDALWASVDQSNSVVCTTSTVGI
jgi:uncharacterized Zn finger protein